MARGHSCDILTKKKNEAAFFPCPRNLPEVKLRSIGLISLVEEISRQPYIDSITWLLVSILTQVYGEKEQARQKEISNTQFEEKKRGPGNLMLEPRLVLKEIRRGLA